MTDTTPVRANFVPNHVLDADDLMTDQAYEIQMRRDHNRLLHGYGVIEGLGVTAKTGTTVTVAAGTAIAPDGMEIVLATLTDFDLGAATADTYVVIAYGEQPNSDDTRVAEKPTVTAAASSPPTDPTSGSLLLATVTRDGSGNVQSADDTHRPTLSPVGPSDLTLTDLTVHPGITQLATLDAKDVTVTGGLSVSSSITGLVNAGTLVPTLGNVRLTYGQTVSFPAFTTSGRSLLLLFLSASLLGIKGTPDAGQVQGYDVIASWTGAVNPIGRLELLVNVDQIHMTCVPILLALPNVPAGSQTITLKLNGSSTTNTTCDWNDRFHLTYIEI